MIVFCSLQIYFQVVSLAMVGSFVSGKVVMQPINSLLFVFVCVYIVFLAFELNVRSK